ncbi:uncharacterized protein PF11_0213-like isoform X4 [Sipha flava]|uniref:Uncharacterized protein PF11_0213-like isoform X4 n=1 Tax=Sipha flava TaxID=143950 RepID=A0A8B8FCW0_9HEMI|nr:uncharacterized protein PF11_0213-like isoform X4 [Sipha flava]
MSRHKDQDALKVGEQSISAEWSATTSVLNSSGATINNSDIHIGTLKECCANPSDTLKYKEDFMVLDSTSTAVNITNFNADDTQFLSTPKAAFQKKHKPYPHNFSHAFDNIIDNESLIEITQSSICLNHFQKRPQFTLPIEEDFVEMNKSDNSGMDNLSMKFPKFRFLKKNMNRSNLDMPDYNLFNSSGTSIINDNNLSKINKNVISKKSSEFSIVNNSSKIVLDASIKEDLTPNKTTNCKNSSILSNIALNDKEISSNYSSMLRVNKSSLHSITDQPCLNHTFDISTNCNSTNIELSSQSIIQSNNKTYIVENDFTSIKSHYNVKSDMNKNFTLSDTYTVGNNLNETFTLPKSANQTNTLNYKKNAAQSAVFENLITNSQETNLTVTQNEMMSNSGLKDQSKYQNNEISMLADSDELLSDSKSIRRSKCSINTHEFGKGPSLEISNDSKDKLNLNNTSKGSSSMAESINENSMEVTNVSIDEKLPEQNNSFDPEDSNNESLSKKTAGSLENNISSKDRVTRSRSKSLLTPTIDASHPFEPNQSSSSKHSTSSTSINISKPVKFVNYTKTAAQSTVFENLITNSQESNLTITQNKMMSNSCLEDPSKMQNDQMNICADSDELLSDRKSIRRSNRSFKKHGIIEGASLRKSKNLKDKLDTKDSLKGSSSMAESINENSMEVANVSIDEKLHEQNNLFEPEDSYNDLLPTIKDGLLENNSSNDRVTRSKSKSLSTHIVVSNSYEPKQSNSSKHSTNSSSLTQHSRNITHNNKTSVLLNNTIGSSKLKRKSIENDEQTTPNECLLKKIKSTTHLAGSVHKDIIAENIVRTIVKMSVNKRKSVHPGVFQFETPTKRQKTFSLDQSNSFLTKFLAGNKNNEPESTLPALSYSESIIDQSQIEENVTKKFKSLYNKESWITKRLYSFLINKLQPKYSIYAVKHAEHFVKYLASRLKDILYDKLDFELCSDMLRYHMARFEIINTTFDYLDFLSNYIPEQYFRKLVPESFDQKFDSNKYFLPIMDDEEFLFKVMNHLNTN